MQLVCKIFKRLLVSLRLLLFSLSSFTVAFFLATNAQAIPLKAIDVTVTYYETPSWVETSGLSISLFESPGNTWATSQMWQDSTFLASAGGALTPGVNMYEVSVAVTNLSNLYISMYGGFNGTQEGAPFPSIFVAEPPTGWVSDELAWVYGPPWISLASLGSGLTLSGDLQIINGYDSQAGTAHPWVVGTWEITTPMPEPATCLLVGFGLIGLIGFRKRNT